MEDIFVIYVKISGCLVRKNGLTGSIQDQEYKKNSIVITTRGRTLHTVKSSVEKQPAGLAYVKSIRCLHCVNDIFEIPV